MQLSFWKRHYRFNILLHVLAWAVFLSLPLLFMGNRNIATTDVLQRWEFWFFGFCFVVPYYLNSYLFTPYIIRTRNYVLYIISLLCIIFACAFWLRPFDRLMQMGGVEKRGQPMFSGKRIPPPPLVYEQGSPFPEALKGRQPGPPPDRGRIDLASVYILVMVIVLGSLVRIIQYWMQSQQRIQEVQHEWTKTELAFLKAQVHPHFLFNTLNNIYSLALVGEPSTATSIYKLSQLMRYYMDERNEEKVSLKEEVQAIQDFIALQKLRIGPNCTLRERYEGVDTDKQIHAFILLPFIENAFKYGLRASGACYLDFAIQIAEDYCLMEVKNSISPELPEQTGSGIGLKNVRKLLEHLYPNSFQLDIRQDKEAFFVKLMLYI